MGDVKYNVDMADYLLTRNEYRGALSFLIIAVAASSTKLFPPGTDSIDNPPKKPGRHNEMPDGEKFKRFLGPRILNIVFNSSIKEDGMHSYLPKIISEANSPEEIIYKECRCPLIHNGVLPDSVIFVVDSELSTAGISFEYSDGVFKFNSGFLSLLREAVVGSHVNANEFNVHHFEPRTKDNGNIDDFYLSVGEDIGLTPGRVKVVSYIICDIYNDNPNITIPDLIERCNLNISSMAGHATFSQNSWGEGEPLCTYEGNVTDTAKKCIEKVIAGLDFVDIGR